MVDIELRKKCLVGWLTLHFIYGRFYSIEEVVAGVVYPDGTPCYTLNHNPYNHDKCAVLSSDVRSLNWSCDNGCKIIIKDSKGGVKLCESYEEFDAWRKAELEPLDKKRKYLNNLKWKSRMDGQVEFDIDNPTNELVVETLTR